MWTFVLLSILTISGTFCANTSTIRATSTTKATALHQNATAPTPTSTVNPRVNISVCYPKVGCFDNFPPFDNALYDLPQSPQKVGTRFLLYTPRNTGDNETIFLDFSSTDSVRNSTYDPAKPTKFVIHGFSNSIKTKWIYEMKNELLKKEPMNVVIVVWGPGAAFPNYDQAVANTRMVGTQTMLLMEKMVQTGASLKDMHLIGHSLGAHTSGYVGYLWNGRGQQVGRITGLDPAEPDFEKHPVVTRLDKSDAAFVDVIHTNGAPISSGGAGLMQESGDVDFYPNGGEVQPGCPGQISGALSSIGEVFKGHFDAFGDAVACSHGRSHAIFTESINSPCPFTSYPCKSYDQFQKGQCMSCGQTGCSQMGYYSDWYRARGKMYMDTRSAVPLCGYHYNIRLRTSPSSKKTRGNVLIRLNGRWGQSDWLKISNDQDLVPGQYMQVMTVSDAEVGDVDDIDVKYQKHNAFLWGDGEDSWKPDRVYIRSGENGEGYLFCMNGQTVTHQAEMNVRRTLTRSC